MWNASAFQVVWFVSDPSHVDASCVYTELTGAEPDQTEKNRILTTQNQFLTRAQGVVNGILNDVRVGAGRVDWFITMHLEADELQFEKLLPTKQSLNMIQDTTSKTNNDRILGAVTRLSVISTLKKPVKTMGEACCILVDMCRIPLKPDGLSDFSFQANRKTRIVGGVEINRLARFSAAIEQRVMMSIDGKQQKIFNYSPQDGVRYAVEVMLDFNTVPSEEEFTASEQRQIFGALLKESAAAADPTLDMFDPQVPA